MRPQFFFLFIFFNLRLNEIAMNAVQETTNRIDDGATVSSDVNQVSDNKFLALQRHENTDEK